MSDDMSHDAFGFAEDKVLKYSIPLPDLVNLERCTKRLGTKFHCRCTYHTRASFGGTTQGPF